MTGSGRIRWVPWRGPNPVLWTLAIALCLLAVVAYAVLPSPVKTGWAGSVPACVALLGVVLAVATSWRQRPRGPRRPPWRGPHPVRNTLASVLALVAPVIYVGDFVLRRGHVLGEGWTRTSLVMAIAFTLLFAKAVASTEHGRGFRWFDRILWGFFAVSQWWFWHQSLTR